MERIGLPFILRLPVNAKKDLRLFENYDNNLIRVDLLVYFNFGTGSSYLTKYSPQNTQLSIIDQGLSICRWSNPHHFLLQTGRILMSIC